MELPRPYNLRVASESITKAQRSAFIAAWLGWGFDGLDGTLYLLVAVKFVTELMVGASKPSKSTPKPRSSKESFSSAGP